MLSKYGRSFALLASLICGVTFSTTQARETVRLTNGEWKPFQSQDLPNYGPYSHIATLAFNEVDIDVEFGFFPWNRATKLVLDGHWDGTFFWVANEERARDYLLSDPVITFREVLFYSKDKPIKAITLKDFEGLTMGRIQSSAFGGQFAPLIESNRLFVTVAPENENLFQMLASGRVDFVPELIHSGYAAVDALEGKIDISRITHSPDFGQDWIYHMLISRKTEKGPYFLRKFNEGLAKILARGEVDRIMAPITQRQKTAAKTN